MKNLGRVQLVQILQTIVAGVLAALIDSSPVGIGRGNRSLEFGQPARWVGNDTRLAKTPCQVIIAQNLFR